MSLEEKWHRSVLFGGSLFDVMWRVIPERSGAGFVFMASIFPNKEVVAEMVRRDQEQLMDLSEHNIPAIFHIETLTGVLIADADISVRNQAATWSGYTEKMGRV